MEGIEYRKLVEAALFMSPKAMNLADISEATGIASAGSLQSILENLVEAYKKADTALEIIELDRRYMFSLKEPYASRMGKLAGSPDISKGALRILAYVSRNEGTVQSDLVKALGEATYEHVKELVEKGFVETKRHKRSKSIKTTNKFKEYFNVGSL